MSASRKSVAATVVALGLVTAAAIVVYSKYPAAVGSSQPSTDTADKQRSAMEEDEVGTRRISGVEAWLISVWIWRGRNDCCLKLARVKETKQRAATK